MAPGLQPRWQEAGWWHLGLRLEARSQRWVPGLPAHCGPGQAAQPGGSWGWWCWLGPHGGRWPQGCAATARTRCAPSRLTGLALARFPFSPSHRARWWLASPEGEGGASLRAQASQGSRLPPGSPGGSAALGPDLPRATCTRPQKYSQPDRTGSPSRQQVAQPQPDSALRGSLSVSQPPATSRSQPWRGCRSAVTRRKPMRWHKAIVSSVSGEG